MTQPDWNREHADITWYNRPDRQAKVLAHIDWAHQTGLEIGPRECPFVPKAAGNVYYMDRFTVESHRDKLENVGMMPEKVAQLVEPDFLVEDGKSLRDLVGPDCQFDYAIASHVIEHIPDVIRWLREVADILKPGGVLSLVVPDRRYSLDYLRPETTLGELVEAYLERYEKPTPRHIFDCLDLWINIAPETVWQTPNLDPTQVAYKNLLENAYRHAKNVHAGANVDSHCWVFTPASLVAIFNKLVRLELFDYKILAFTDTARDDFEFFITLQKLHPSEKAEPYRLPA